MKIVLVQLAFPWRTTEKLPELLFFFSLKLKFAVGFRMHAHEHGVYCCPLGRCCLYRWYCIHLGPWISLHLPKEKTPKERFLCMRQQTGRQHIHTLSGIQLSAREDGGSCSQELHTGDKQTIKSQLCWLPAGWLRVRLSLHF